jgi:hypothetical protein
LPRPPPARIAVAAGSRVESELEAIGHAVRRLPDQRAELYMEMVDTLLTSSYNPDEEVAQRLAQLGGDWRSRRDMAQTLAYAMHSQGETAGRQIAERPMAQLLCDYLVERRYKPAEVAET